MAGKKHSQTKISEKEFRKMDPDERISFMSSGLETPPGMSTEEALEKVRSGINTPRRKTVNLRPMYWSAAAVLLIVLGAYFGFISNAREKVVANNGQHSEIFLPDSSFVVLNAGTKIRYSEKKFLKNRKLMLSGEAFFKVRKGSRFTIKTKNGKVEILGTELNVLSRSNRFEVGCITGKVSVIYEAHNVVITGGQEAKLDGNTLIKNEEAKKQKISQWRYGEFNFEDEPLVYIFEELERQFNVKIDLPQLKGRRYTGGFSNKSLEEALSQVCIPMGLNYDIKNKKRVIIFDKM